MNTILPNIIYWQEIDQMIIDKSLESNVHKFVRNILYLVNDILCIYFICIHSYKKDSKKNDKKKDKFNKYGKFSAKGKRAILTNQTLNENKKKRGPKSNKNKK